MDRNKTIMDILEAGKMEFLQYGYEGASLRRIARTASVTTGAIYGYFPGKEALFDALTGEAADELLDAYTAAHEQFSLIPAEKQAEELERVTNEAMPWMIHYIYDHFDAFKLLFCCGPQESCENFISQLAEVEETSTKNFIKSLQSVGYQVPEIDDSLIHILCSTFFQQIRECIVHDVPRQKALTYASLLSAYQHAGWLKIMGL